MSKLSSELAIIPKPAWVVAVVVYLGFAVLFPRLVSQDPNPPPAEYMVLLGVLVSVIPGTYALMAGYVYGDSKRRAMRPVVWTLLAVFIPNAIGFILYFLIRQPIRKPCPKCAAPVNETFVFCPSCGETLGAVCPACRRRVDAGWANCAYCGTHIRERQNRTTGSAA